MERYITFLILIVSFNLFASGQDNTASEKKLNLQKGDIFVYRINNQNTWSRKYSEGVFSSANPSGKQNIVHTTRDSDSKLYFEVLEKQNKDCYLLKYRKEYTIYSTKTDNTSSAGDSRFPEYGIRPEAVMQCFLNTVSYQIRFCVSSGKIEIVNLNQIRKDLITYLDSRSIPNDVRRDDTITHYLEQNEKNILYELEFLNYMTNVYNRRSNKIKAEDGESTTYTFEVEDFNMRLDDSFPDNIYTKIGSCTFDNKSGLLVNLVASSYLGKEKIKTDKLIPGRSDIADYSENIELEYYSATCKPTWICGTVKVPDVNRIGLSSKKVLIGSETEYTEYHKDSTGYFAIPLDIHENKKYALHFLKKFPSFPGNGELEFFVKPGDSIYVSFDTLTNTYVYSGRRYKDSEVLQRRSLSFKTGTSYMLAYPSVALSFNRSYISEQYRYHISHLLQAFNTEKDNVSKEFLEFMQSEFNSAQSILRYHEYWETFSEEYLNGNKVTLDNEILRLPEIPSFPDYTMLNQYNALINTYIILRYYLFNYVNTGNLPVGPRLGYDIDFQKALLSGVPYYINIGNLMVDLITARSNLPVRDTRDYRIEDFMENCNHQESRDYMNDLIHRRNLILPGSNRPALNLLDLNGNQFNWEDARGKVIVLMLYRDYSREHYFCEDIFKKYGENKKDVIVLRISPGINFKKWKEHNEPYSRLGHQMYYTDGEHAFSRQFLTNRGNDSRYLIIDRQGKIFRNPNTPQELKGAISATINQAPPPKTPFFETRAGRILPGAILGIILTFIFYRIIVNRRIRKSELKHQLSSMEQKAIKAQLNPHFLFNSLNSIQNLISKNKLNEANDYLTSFASLIRRILKYSEKEEISIHDDLETLKIYIELERLRFNFNTIIEIDPQVDIYNTMIPPLLLQPAVENAILHGLDPKNGDKQLRIEVAIQSGSIVFRIDDNGIGRKSLANDDSEEPKGLHIIKSRVDLLNVTQADKYSYKIFDKTDDLGKSTGTTVEIVIPDEK